VAALLQWVVEVLALEVVIVLVLVVASDLVVDGALARAEETMLGLARAAENLRACACGTIRVLELLKDDVDVFEEEEQEDEED
jgi:hypothetical protein